MVLLAMRSIVQRRRSRASSPRGIAKAAKLERFPAKWTPVRVKKTRQNKKLEPRSDSIGTEKALASRPGRGAAFFTLLRRAGTHNAIRAHGPRFPDRSVCGFRPGHDPADVFRLWHFRRWRQFCAVV